MNIEDPRAFHFIMHDDVYLLNNDKALYNNPTATKPVAKTPPEKLEYLGENKKRFLIITHYPAFGFMDDKHLTALENALKRLTFDIADVAIFNMAKYPGCTFDQLEVFFNPEKILVLGKNSTPLNMDNLLFNGLNQIKNCKVLSTFNFDEMMDNTENKKTFWEKLKQL